MTVLSGQRVWTGVNVHLILLCGTAATVFVPGSSSRGFLSPRIACVMICVFERPSALSATRSVYSRTQPDLLDSQIA